MSFQFFFISTNGKSLSSIPLGFQFFFISTIKNPRTGEKITLSVLLYFDKYELPDITEVFYFQFFFISTTPKNFKSLG